MDRGNIGRLLLIAAGVFLVLFIFPKLFGGHSATQPLKPEHVVSLAQRPPERTCDIWTPDFNAVVSTQSASLKHFYLVRAKYEHQGRPIDLSTTPDYEPRRQLRFDYRNPAAKIADADWQVPADLLDYEVVKQDGKTCELAFKNDSVEIRQVFSATGRPYELEVSATVTNLGPRPLKHAATLDNDAWRTESEVKGHMMRVSPLVTHVECVADAGKTTRLNVGDFEAKSFADHEHFPISNLTQGDWYQAPGKPAVGSVSTAYFSHAIVPLASSTPPVCQLQIEERWDPQHFSSKSNDPNAGAMYRARFAYPTQELKPGDKASYSALAFIGPKERKVLAQAGGGHTQLTELIDLGFFSAIAKVLVAFLLKVHSVVPNWGIAIIVLTLTARTLLFPLSLPGIRNMIRMRELKPEIDALNDKFKDDAQAKGLAQMELWRKHNVNPLKGCLPQLASMPVWFALYTTLQTAVELYNIPFLWFPDLSAADPLYILPFVIGGTSFMQQRLMPQMQGDPAQQKMMLYFMPAMFTVFMLFLPSGLGVYMFTNGLLGILQQQAVEWHARRSIGSGGGGIQVKEVTRSDKGKTDKSKALGGAGNKTKKEEPEDKDGSAKISGNHLLGKGKA